jgi:hypothetical protein
VEIFMAGEIIVWVGRISVFEFCLRYFTHLGPTEGAEKDFLGLSPRPTALIWG